MGKVKYMKNGIEKLGYSSIIFYAFAVSFFILSIFNAFLPISNFKMTILSLVALLFSLQQMYEAREDVDNKIAELEKKSSYQEDLLQLLDSSEYYSQKQEKSMTPSAKSKWTFAIGMTILTVGLTLDFDFENGAIANTATIVSFAVLFFTMGYKEQYTARINRLNEELSAIDKRIIVRLKKQVEDLQQL